MGGDGVVISGRLSTKYRMCVHPMILWCVVGDGWMWKYPCRWSFQSSKFGWKLSRLGRGIDVVSALGRFRSVSVGLPLTGLVAM